MLHNLNRAEEKKVSDEAFVSGLDAAAAAEAASGQTAAVSTGV